MEITLLDEQGRVEPRLAFRSSNLEESEEMGQLLLIMQLAEVHVQYKHNQPLDHQEYSAHIQIA